jgi:hypothetical protein
MDSLFHPLQLAFNALILGGLLWVWARSRSRPAEPQPAPPQPPESLQFEPLLHAEELTRGLQEALQAADARLRALRVSASESAPEPNHTRSAVWALHRRGIDPRSIAEELSLSQDEVRLVLSLKSPQAPGRAVDN